MALIKSFLAPFLLLLTLLGLGLCPATATADGTFNNLQSCAQTNGVINFDDCVQDSDLSKKYLEMMFGNMGTILQGESRGISNDLMARIFKIFNVVVLTLGSIVVMYTTILSTINSAQEGEIMGKKWSSIWIPVRSVAGVSFLLPMAKGYSLIQILIMWVIVQGIGAANATWNTVLDYSLIGGSINQPMSMPNSQGLTNSMQAMLKSMICMETINNSPQFLAITGPIEVYSYGQTTLNVGNMDNAPYNAVCGSVSLPALPSALANSSNADQETADESKIAVQQNVLSALRKIYRYLDTAADEAVTLDSSLWGVSGAITSATMAYTDKLHDIFDRTAPKTQDADKLAMVTNAKQDGWITAGSYYSKLIRPNDALAAQAQSYQIPPLTGSFPGNIWSDSVNNTYTKYLAFTEPAGSDARTDIGLGPTNALKDQGKEIWDNSFGAAFTDLAIAFMQHLTNNDPDPLVSMQKFGSDITITIEILWFTAITVIFALMLASGFMPGISPAIAAIASFTNLLMTVVGFMLAFLWAAGASLAIYLPLIPYTLFTFGALSWMMIVLESVIAAPIVALGLTAPSNDHLGRAAPALLLIAGVFLRPSLMVIGFVASARLFNAIMMLVKFSFVGVVKATITGLGLFGGIGLVVLYGGVAVTLAHESFSLIYLLPDRILRWIGGTPEQSNVAQMEQQAQQTYQQGSQMAGSLGTSSSAEIGKKSEELKQKAASKKDKGGGIEGGGGGDQSSPGKGDKGGANPLGGGGGGGGSGGGTSAGGGAPMPPQAKVASMAASKGK